MIEQITESIRFDLPVELMVIDVPVLVSVDAFRAKIVQDAIDNVQYAEERLTAITRSCDESNRWLDALIESLRPVIDEDLFEEGK